MHTLEGLPIQYQFSSGHYIVDLTVLKMNLMKLAGLIQEPTTTTKYIDHSTNLLLFLLMLTLEGWTIDHMLTNPISV